MQQKLKVGFFSGLIAIALITGCSSKKEVTSDNTAPSGGAVSNAPVSSAPVAQDTRSTKDNLGASSSGRGK